MGTAVLRSLSKLTQLPEGCSTREYSYDKSGWPTYERCSAELGKSYFLHGATWKLVIDAGSKDGGVDRRLPTIPKRMNDLLASRHFTNGSDKEVVLELYEKTARGILRGKLEFDFSGMTVLCGDEWRSPEQLAETLNRCACLEVLHLCACRIDDDALERLSGKLVRRALPSLKELDISANRFGKAGIAKLGAVLADGVAMDLETIQMFALGEACGDEGIKQFAGAIARGAAPKLSMLNLLANDAGNDGAAVLATALVMRDAKCRVNFMVNARIGIRGRAMMTLALQALHGPEFIHPFSSIPVPAQRAFARGFRAILEQEFGNVELQLGPYVTITSAQTHQSEAMAAIEDA